MCMLFIFFYKYYLSEKKFKKLVQISSSYGYAMCRKYEFNMVMYCSSLTVIPSVQRSPCDTFYPNDIISFVCYGW